MKGIRFLLLAVLGPVLATVAEAQAGPGAAGRDLFAAIFRSDSVELLRALAEGESPNGRGPSRMTALMSAAEFSRPAMVRLLLAHGADPDLLGADPAVGNAINAALAGLNGLQLLGRSDEPSRRKHAISLEVLRLLLQRRADPNLIAELPQGAMSPLMLAAQAGTPDVVLLLLGGGARVNLTSRSGYTALDYAVDRPPAWATSSASDRLQCVAALLSAGAEVNRAGADKITPLSRAERTGQEEIWAALKAAGARGDR